MLKIRSNNQEASTRFPLFNKERGLKKHSFAPPFQHIATLFVSFGRLPLR
jgi:hypothetical protein